LFRAKALVHSFLFGSCAARKKKRMQPRKEKRGLIKFLVFSFLSFIPAPEGKRKKRQEIKN